MNNNQIGFKFIYIPNDMKKILFLFFILNINILAADDCGVNVYNTATGKLHKKFLVVNSAHSKNKKIVLKRCSTAVEKNEFDVNSFNIIAKCEFEKGDKIFNRLTDKYEDVDSSEISIMATYSYNMFAYEMNCSNN